MGGPALLVASTVHWRGFKFHGSYTAIDLIAGWPESGRKSPVSVVSARTRPSKAGAVVRGFFPRSAGASFIADCLTNGDGRYAATYGVQPCVVA
jgi:phage terminase large subunit GpA-like protein